MKFFGTDYGIRLIEVEIENRVYHLHIKRNGLNYNIVDIFKLAKDGEYYPIQFEQNKIIDLTYRDIIKSIIWDVKKLIKKLFSTI